MDSLSMSQMDCNKSTAFTQIQCPIPILMLSITMLLALTLTLSLTLNRRPLRIHIFRGALRRSNIRRSTMSRFRANCNSIGNSKSGLRRNRGSL